MISLQPRSIPQLTVTGFAAVTVLLLVALIITANELDGLSDRSQSVINQSVTAMGASGTLMEQASALERHAGNYFDTGERRILEDYAERRQRFAEAARAISRLELGQAMNTLINDLIRHEALAFAALNQQAVEESAPLYPQLMDMSRRVSDLVSVWSRRQLAGIRADTRETQTLLTVQAVVLVGAALVLAGIFTALITRPLLQMDKAINQLGSGLYTRPISITGPRDLTNLGDRLDWLRNRLDRLEQQRSSFLRHASHELKTPLAAMQESTSLLQEEVVGPVNREQAEIIGILANNCHRLQELIDELLRYGSESVSILNSMPQPVRLDQVVNSVIADHEYTLRSARLSVSLAMAKVSVGGDHEQLRVVLDNLFTNAMRFSPREGVVTIHLREEGGEAVLDMIDEGPGIPPEERKKVFNAFYQAPDSQQAFLKGSGLGLAIVQEYAKANGGNVEVVDRRRGAHLRLRFPLLRQAKE